MIPRLPFGRTGHASSRVLFGAAALGSMSQERADRTLALLDDFGVNHLDTAAGYGDSELRLAPLLARRRGDFFLATKTGERTAAGARASLERSLQRLGVDQVDLVQLHNLVEDDEWETAHGPGGAVEALVQARDEGLTRFIGVTGHGLRIAGMHRRSLERFDFDSILLPLNWVLWSNPTYRADAEAVLAVAGSRQVAVQTIKSLARRRWADQSAAHHSWYEPIGDPEAAARSIRWVLSNPGIFLNSSSDADLLRLTLEAAETAADEPVPSDDELAADQGNQRMEALFDGNRLERI